MLRRSINIDAVKAIAACSVVCVHFFHNSGFYAFELHGVWGLLATGMRTLFMVCVPLFLLTTGYLMKNKSISMQYYLGIMKVLFAYVMLCVISLAWRAVYHGEDISLIGSIKMILDYSACSYTWYVQMYIGLYLLIPFLNALYRGLESKRSRSALLLVLFFIITIPQSINPFFSILPDWWSGSLFPLLFYYLGAYIRDYYQTDGLILPGSRKALGSTSLFILFTIWVSGCSVFNYLICINSRGNLFGGDGYTDWGGIENVVSSVLLFLLVLGLRLDAVPSMIKKLVICISSCSFAMYLSSGIVDKTLYPVLLNAIGDFAALFPCYLPIVCFVLTCSLLLAIPVTMASEKLSKYVVTIIARLNGHPAQ